MDLHITVLLIRCKRPVPASKRPERGVCFTLPQALRFLSAEQVLLLCLF